MDYLDEYRKKSCGCRDQKAMFRDSIGVTHTTWVRRIQCKKHKEEYDDLMRWFTEGGSESSEIEEFEEEFKDVDKKDEPM